jgi:hypothetical protein
VLKGLAGAEVGGDGQGGDQLGGADRGCSARLLRAASATDPHAPIRAMLAQDAGRVWWTRARRLGRTIRSYVRWHNATTTWYGETQIIELGIRFRGGRSASVAGTVACHR